MKKYQVIGGQYYHHWYGESDSLHGAKVIAGRNKEYWDNWQGWHTPVVYAAEDVMEVETETGTIRVPIWPVAIPVWPVAKRTVTPSRRWSDEV